MTERDRLVRGLLATVVDSFEKLEVVVHLHGAQLVAQTVAEIAAARSLRDDDTAEALAELVTAGVLLSKPDKPARWSFDPNGAWVPACNVLVEQYDHDRFAVMKLLTELAFARVRSHAAQVFADAFVIRGKKPKGEPDA